MSAMLQLAVWRDIHVGTSWISRQYLYLINRIARIKFDNLITIFIATRAMTDCQREGEVPLQQLEMDGEPKMKSRKEAFGGLFLNKTKLIALAVVILILLIIIIVLAAVLGHERAKDKREITRK